MTNFVTPNSIVEFLLKLEEKYGSRISHSIKMNNQWVNYTYKQSIDSAFSLMHTMKTSGVVTGDKVLIISRNRPEFCFSFFACALMGVVAIPVDPRMNTKDLQFIYNHSEANAIISLMKEDNILVGQISKGGKEAHLIESNFSELNMRPETVEAVVDFDQPALIIYTSGTTSRPKGVIVSFNNLFSQVETITNDTFLLQDDLRYLSILPLNHLLEFTTGMLLPFSNGGEVCYAGSLLPASIIESLKEKQIREMICVPLFLKMLRKGIEAKMNEKKSLQLYLKTGMFFSSFVKSKLLKKIIFLPLHFSFGGQLRRFISGGSSLDNETENFFENLGFAVFQGYGLTETSPVATTNTARKCKIGTVGIALKGVSVRTDDQTGEIMIKGPNVMKGYYKDQALTDEVIRDGWFYTGDVGVLDENGFLSITGRIKELIVLDNGKKIAPQDVEEELMESNPYLKEVCVIGSKVTKGSMKNTEEVCAVIVPSEAYMQADDKLICDLIRSKLQSISDYKRPTRIVVQRNELDKTSTLKTKRLYIKMQLEITDQNAFAMNIVSTGNGPGILLNKNDSGVSISSNVDQTTVSMTK